MKRFSNNLVGSFLLLTLAFSAQSCTRFTDGTSVFSGGLWLIPVILFLGGLAAIWYADKISKSNSTRDNGDGTREDNTGNVPITQIWHFRGGVLLIILAIAFVIYVNYFYK